MILDLLGIVLGLPFYIALQLACYGLCLILTCWIRLARLSGFSGSWRVELWDVTVSAEVPLWIRGRT